MYAFLHGSRDYGVMTSPFHVVIYIVFAPLPGSLLLNYAFLQCFRDYGVTTSPLSVVIYTVFAPIPGVLLLKKRQNVTFACKSITMELRHLNFL